MRLDKKDLEGEESKIDLERREGNCGRSDIVTLLLSILAQHVLSLLHMRNAPVF